MNNINIITNIKELLVIITNNTILCLKKIVYTYTNIINWINLLLVKIYIVGTL